MNENLANEQIENLFAKQTPDTSSGVFSRGQVWFWEDPVYGEKEDGISIPMLEHTMRYSRYVVIMHTVQNTTSDILVVPISSVSINKFDVPVSVHHVSIEPTATFARVQYCFPAAPLSLKRYVSQLSHKEMSLISFRLMQLIMQPSVTNFVGKQLVDFYNFSQEELSGDDNIIYKVNQEIPKKNTYRDLFYDDRYINSIPSVLKFIFANKKFSREDLESEFSISDPVEFDNLIYSLTKYGFIDEIVCSEKSKINSNEYQTLITSMKQFMDCEVYNRIIYGVIGVDDFITTIQKIFKENEESNQAKEGEIKGKKKVTTKKNTKKKSSGPKNVWTPEKYEEFFQFYTEHGAKAAAKEYDIALATAYTYFSTAKYMKEREKNAEEAEKKLEEEKRSSIMDYQLSIKDLDQYKENAYMIPTYVEEFAKAIRSYFQTRNAFITYRKGNKKYKEKSKESNRFYSGLSKGIMFSLFDMLNVKYEADGTVYKYELSISDDGLIDHIHTIMFIMRVHEHYTSNPVLDKVSIDGVLDYVHQCFPNDRIDTEWGNLLVARLDKTIGTVNFNTGILAGSILAMVNASNNES